MRVLMQQCMHAQNAQMPAPGVCRLFAPRQILKKSQKRSSGDCAARAKGIISPACSPEIVCVCVRARKVSSWWLVSGEDAGTTGNKTGLAEEKRDERKTRANQMPNVGSWRACPRVYANVQEFPVRARGVKCRKKRQKLSKANVSGRFPECRGRGDGLLVVSNVIRSIERSVDSKRVEA
jgi:hypothetical protein